MAKITKFDSIIVRFGGEIGIKSEWTRRSYEKLLLKNMRKSFKHHGVAPETIIQRRGRIYIITEDSKEATLPLKQVFGISSFSPAIRTSSNMKSMLQSAVCLASSKFNKGATFAVRCHRVGTQSYSSMDVCREVGSQVLESLDDRGLRVDLTSPQYTLGIEVRESDAYIFADTLQGGGGFPVGSQPRAIALLSGGIDSPVACWLTMKRGCPITPVYLDNAPLTDEATKEKALEVAKKLFEWSIGFSRRVYVVPHGKNLETFLARAPRKYICLLCKRIMYRIAERIADIENAEGIVTGEAIGEQASQTLSNLRVLNQAATKYPIHRPLLGFDKDETVELARRIGTFEVSTRKAKGCGAAPSRPATMAKLERITEAEAELDIESMVEESVEKAEIVNV